MEQFFKMALENIARHGDTDVFPFPLETKVFFDEPLRARAVLESIHKDFEGHLLNTPPVHENALSVVGYSGFRWVTQIDPIWNAYFLSLVLSVASDIEAARLPVDKRVVFSYRYRPDKEHKTLFSSEIGWRQFQMRSVELAHESKVVLVCDISDFYPRIYHHRLENALKRATRNDTATGRIMDLLQRFSSGVSYGLPVGGPAARLLSELLLNRVDRLLRTAGIRFVRFVDDYHIFTDTEQEAYAALVLLSERLLENEGLSLQKSKTRVMSSEEFLATSEFADENPPQDDDEGRGRAFLSLRLHFDPYSPTAEEDYEKLRDAVDKFDVVGMLATEIRKSRVNQTLVRRLISAVRVLKGPLQRDAVVSIVDNLAVLYPVFPNVMLLCRGVISDLDDEARNKVFSTIRSLIRDDSYIVKVPVNLGYAIRVLGYDPSEEADEVLSNTFNSTPHMFIRRDIILAMAKRNADFWLSDLRKRFHSLSIWERRAVLIGSYLLEDEGKHWRVAINKELSEVDQLTVSWAASKKQANKWEIPL